MRLGLALESPVMVTGRVKTNCRNCQNCRIGSTCTSVNLRTSQDPTGLRCGDNSALTIVYLPRILVCATSNALLSTECKSEESRVA
jgi:hypothetical protein